MLFPSFLIVRFNIFLGRRKYRRAQEDGRWCLGASTAREPQHQQQMVVPLHFLCLCVCRVCVRVFARATTAHFDLFVWSPWILSFFSCWVLEGNRQVSIRLFSRIVPPCPSLIIIIIINYIFPRSRPHPHLLVLFGLECGISWFCFVYYFLGSDQWLVLFPFCLLAIIDLHPSFTFGKRRSVAAFFCVFFPSPSRSSVVSSSRKKNTSNISHFHLFFLFVHLLCLFFINFFRYIPPKRYYLCWTFFPFKIDYSKFSKSFQKKNLYK